MGIKGSMALPMRKKQSSSERSFMHVDYADWCCSEWYDMNRYNEARSKYGSDQAFSRLYQKVKR